MNARQVVVDVLNRSRSRDGFAAELVDDALASANLSPLDRRFVTQLVFGVIRRSGTLDALLKPFIQIPLHAVQPRVWDVLRLGAFQLVFLTHVPKHAAVHETVELTAHVGAMKAKGFINGVLRRIAEVVTDEFVTHPASDAVPFEYVGPNPPTPFPKKEGGEKPAWHVVRGQHIAKDKLELAKKLRREMTPAERIMWEQVRDNRLGYHFRRQQVIGGYIADFYCHQAGLVIELDGAVHEDRAEYDAARTEVIKVFGIEVIRFSNSEVASNLASILERITAACRRRIAHRPNPPAPFPKREGGRGVRSYAFREGGGRFCTLPQVHATASSLARR